MIPLIIIFVLGYTAIALEHKIKIDKSISAILTGVLIWTTIVLLEIPLVDKMSAEQAISHHFGEITSILFFLIGAMTIVNALDKRGSLILIQRFLKTENQTKLLWLVTTISFFLSAVLDNMTTTIVMIAILRKVIRERGDLLVFGVIVIISANAGGAWSPIGDVTTTMLWVGEKLSTGELIKTVFLPSVVQAIFIPMVLTIFPKMLNKLTQGVVELQEENEEKIEDYNGKMTMLIAGIFALVFVPIFKSVTHLPAWLGMMFSMSMILLLNEFLNKKSDKRIIGEHLLAKVEWNAVIFFLGILTAVSGFQSIIIGEVNSLQYAAQGIQNHVSQELFGTLIGILSAVVDNVPLVAAAQGMFEYPIDHWFWHFIAYSAGTGGSILIIGSAAGVVAMGLLKIDFMWYMKKFSILILLSYLLGAAMFLLLFKS